MGSKHWIPRWHHAALIQGRRWKNMMENLKKRGLPTCGWDPRRLTFWQCWRRKKFMVMIQIEFLLTWSRYRDVLAATVRDKQLALLLVKMFCSHLRWLWIWWKEWMNGRLMIRECVFCTRSDWLNSTVHEWVERRSSSKGGIRKRRSGFHQKDPS